VRHRPKRKTPICLVLREERPRVVSGLGDPTPPGTDTIAHTGAVGIPCRKDDTSGTRSWGDDRRSAGNSQSSAGSAGMALSMLTCRVGRIRRRSCPSPSGPVSDIDETPDVASPYCPGCDSQRDPIHEILVVCWCDQHRPSCASPDDDLATLGRSLLNAFGEAEAESNRPWCELVHRTLNHSKPARRARSASRASGGRPSGA